MSAGLRSDNRIGLKTTRTTDASPSTLLATNLTGSGITIMVFTTTRDRHASYSLIVYVVVRAQKTKVHNFVLQCLIAVAGTDFDVQQSASLVHVCGHEA